MPPSCTQTDRDRFFELATQNPVNEIILRRLPDLDLPDCYLVAGCLCQTVWNCLSGRPPGENILDYDIFYYDSSDLSWEAEDSAIRWCSQVFADLEEPIQVRNQARVHLWYGEKFGVECPPLRSSSDGIDHFLNQSSCFGVYRDGESIEVYAPFGFRDLFAMIIRPNRRRQLPDIYHQKSARWAQAWPDLTVIPWSDGED